MSPDGNTLIVLGLIQKPRGLMGELFVRPYQPDSASFRRGLPVVIKTDKISLNTTIEEVKQAGRRLSVKYEGINDRYTADNYKGGELLCQFSLLPPRKTGEYFVFELIGLKVINNSGEVVGEIKDVLNFPANDVLLVDSEPGEIMVPLIKKVIEQISIEEGFVKINNINDFILS